VEPDLAGFRAAQDRARELFGEAVIMLAPVVVAEWPAGTALDPETNQPFDPTIQPVSSGQASASVNAVVMQRVPSDVAERATAIGDLSTYSLILDVSPADHALASAATRAVVRDDVYQVARWLPDGVKGTDRWLAFLEDVR
jgi:hypothetical protein